MSIEFIELPDAKMRIIGPDIWFQILFTFQPAIKRVQETIGRIINNQDIQIRIFLMKDSPFASQFVNCLIQLLGLEQVQKLGFQVPELLQPAAV